MVPTKEDKRMVSGQFLLICQFFFDTYICFLWSFCFDHTNSIHHSMHMCIDSDIRRIIQNRKYYFGSFDSDSWQGLELFEIIWYPTFKFTNQFLSRISNKYCFISIKIDRRNHSLDLGDGEFSDVTWLPNQRKKLRGSPIYLFICCLSRKNNCY